MGMWVGTSVISPGGRVHPAAFYHHDEVCDAICAQEDITGAEYPATRLARRGWIKLTADGWLYSTEYGPLNTITQAQFDALFDMVMALNEGRKPDDGEFTAAGLLERLHKLEVR